MKFPGRKKIRVRGDYEAMEEQMKGVNWEEELYGKDVNGIWEVICDKITDAVERNVPKMKTNIAGKQGASSIMILRISK